MIPRAAPHPLERRFLALLRRRPDLVPPGSRVLVALSGGPDSTALLALLVAVRPELGLALLAAHFDHALREGSEAEAAAVAARARALGVPCEIGRAPAPLRPRQAELRAARYAFLTRVAHAAGARRIATGHQADDQAETVLFRLLRGSGLRGLAGIPVRRGRVVRPLLGVWRGELLAYLEARGLPWLDDPSNRDPRWTRTRLREAILPELERAGGPDARRRLVRLGRAARRAERALERAAAHAARGCVRPGETGETLLLRDGLLRLPGEIRARLLRRLCAREGVTLTRGGTRAAMAFISGGRSGGRVDLGGGLILAREFDLLALRAGYGPAERPPGRAPPGGELAIAGPESGAGDLRLPGATFRVVWGRRSASTPEPLRVALPPEPGQFPLRLRSWRPGDRIRLAGGTRKLKRLFADRRIPRSRRAGIPVLEDAAGRVLWVAGVAVDRERVREPSHPEAFVIELGG